jgi:hypothetical protein
MSYLNIHWSKVAQDVIHSRAYMMTVLKFRIILFVAQLFW